MSDKHIIKKQFEKCSTAILLSSSGQGISLCAWLLGDICSFIISRSLYFSLYLALLVNLDFCWDSFICVDQRAYRA